MARIKKPRPPFEPKRLTIEQWASAKYKRKAILKGKPGETLTQMVGRLCLEISEGDPDKVIFEGSVYATGSYNNYSFSTITITDELQREYNKYTVKFEEDLEKYNKAQQEYRHQMEAWKQQMISKLKAM